MLSKTNELSELLFSDNCNPATSCSSPALGFGVVSPIHQVQFPLGQLRMLQYLQHCCNEAAAFCIRMSSAAADSDLECSKHLFKRAQFVLNKVVLCVWVPLL